MSEKTIKYTPKTSNKKLVLDRSIKEPAYKPKPLNKLKEIRDAIIEKKAGQ